MSVACGVKLGFARGFRSVIVERMKRSEMTFCCCFSWDSLCGNDGVEAITKPGDELLNAWQSHFLLLSKTEDDEVVLGCILIDCGSGQNVMGAGSFLFVDWF